MVFQIQSSTDWHLCFSWLSMALSPIPNNFLCNCKCWLRVFSCSIYIVWSNVNVSHMINLPQDGVILGADTRATEGPIVADKNCEKIHYMAPNIYCCGAGTAADTEAVTGIFQNASFLLYIFISCLMDFCIWLVFRFWSC